MKKIVIDTLGSDNGADIIINAIAKSIKSLHIFPVLVGDGDLINRIMQENDIADSQYEIIHTTDYISNNEPATSIFGGRDNCSIALGYKKLKEDDSCFGMLSAGSTGALLIGSICRLGLLNSIKLPALCSALPCTDENLVCLVDCGAVIDCNENDLVKFAKMGNVFSKCYCSIPNPRIGIMSVGREDAKGSALTLKTFDILKTLDLNFIGNLEGNDVVSGYADVIVTDGFSGNILLKNTEAVGKKAIEIVEKFGIQNPELISQIKKELLSYFDFNSRGAATFLGTSKTVVKMHGCATEETTISSIKQILRLLDSNFIEEMKHALDA